MYKSKKKIIFTFLFPSLLGLLVFKVGAMLYSLYISFTDWNLFGTPKFVGLENYITIFQDERFYEALKNTVLFIIGYLPIVLVLSLGIAMLLNAKVKKVNVFRGLILSSSNNVMGSSLYDLERAFESRIWSD